MGLQLMSGLSKEMKGNYRFENKNGITITIVFKNDALDEMYNLETDFFNLNNEGESSYGN
jgi:hypothetical protein